MKVLFLDDRDIRVNTFVKVHPGCVVVRCAFSAIEAMKSETWDQVWLDHDLNDQSHCPPEKRPANNGITVAKWIVENLPPVGQFVIHSTASREAPIMAKMLRTAGYYTHVQPMDN